MMGGENMAAGAIGAWKQAAKLIAEVRNRAEKLKNI